MSLLSETRIGLVKYILIYLFLVAVYVDSYAYGTFYGSQYTHLVSLLGWVVFLFFDSCLGSDLNGSLRITRRAAARVNVCLGRCCRYTTYYPEEVSFPMLSALVLSVALVVQILCVVLDLLTFPRLVSCAPPECVVLEGITFATFLTVLVAFEIYGLISTGATLLALLFRSRKYKNALRVEWRTDCFAWVRLAAHVIRLLFVGMRPDSFGFVAAVLDLLWLVAVWVRADSPNYFDARLAASASKAGQEVFDNRVVFRLMFLFNFGGNALLLLLQLLRERTVSANMLVVLTCGVLLTTPHDRFGLSGPVDEDEDSPLPIGAPPRAAARAAPRMQSMPVRSSFDFSTRLRR
jgi:hypothetical protein